MRRTVSFGFRGWVGVFLVAQVGSGLGEEEPRQRVIGKLIDFRERELLIQDEKTEEKLSLVLDERTRLQVRGEGKASLVRPGMVVQVEGDVRANSNVIQASMLTVWLDGSGPTVNTNGGAYYKLEAKRASGVIPVIISGEVIGVAPLRFRGGNSLFSRYYFSDEVDDSGEPRDVYEFQSIGKEFEVEYPESSPVMVDLARNVLLAGREAHVTAYVRPRDGFVDAVFLTRAEPVTDELLGLAGEKGKKKGRRGRSAITDREERAEGKKAEASESAHDGRGSARQSSKQRAAEKQFQLGVAKLKAGEREDADRFFAKAKRLDDSDAMAAKIEDALAGEDEAADDEK